MSNDSPIQVRRERKRAYRKRNREQVRERNRAYYERNRERCRESSRAYRERTGQEAMLRVLEKNPGLLEKSLKKTEELYGD